MKLLLVEDSQRLRDTLARGLRAAGFTVDVAADGVEANGFLTGFDYDFVLLDLGLTRMDGFGVLRALPLARLHALARRPAEARADVLAHADIRLDARAHRATCGEQALNLTPREFALLELLLRHRGRVFTRAAILERIAGSGSDVSDRSVEVLVFGLRRKLDEAGCAGLIENRRGAGYIIA